MSIAAGSAPLVTIITPVLNGERTLPALITAMAALLPPQSKRIPQTGWEWLVVDNGSTDGTAGILAAAKVEGMRVLGEQKRGPAAARNRALREAKADIVAMIDADCVPTRQWLRELVVAFDDPDVILVGGGLATFPPQTAAQRFAASYGFNDATRTIGMARMPFVNTRNLAVLRSAAVEVGGLDEDLIGGEDVEFSFALRERFRCSITYRPSALVLHQDRADDAALKDQAISYGRNMAHLYARHPDLLPWGTRERLMRFRTSSRRRANAAAAILATRLAGSSSDREFAIYLARWNAWFWRGFDETRTSTTSSR